MIFVISNILNTFIQIIIYVNDLKVLSSYSIHIFCSIEFLTFLQLLICRGEYIIQYNKINFFVLHFVILIFCYELWYRFVMTFSIFKFLGLYLESKSCILYCGVRKLLTFLFLVKNESNSNNSNRNWFSSSDKWHGSRHSYNT